jgi:hypothetical protein
VQKGEQKTIWIFHGINGDGDRFFGLYPEITMLGFAIANNMNHNLVSRYKRSTFCNGWLR